MDSVRPSARAARLEAAVARAVAAAPPLSDRTIARLSVLLGPTSSPAGTDEKPAA